MKRPLMLGVVGALLVAAALAVYVWRAPSDPTAAPARVAQPVPDSPRPLPPAGAAPAAPSAAATSAPSFDVVRVDPRGATVIAGRAAPQAEVHVLDGTREIGSVTADANGEWVLLPSAPLPSGSHSLSLVTQPPGAAPTRSEPVVVQVAPAPAVARAAADAAASHDASTVVAPGNSLWALARERYGDGKRYGMIFEANRQQIRDPDLIYPGQVFVMPPNP